MEPPNARSNAFSPAPLKPSRSSRSSRIDNQKQKLQSTGVSLNTLTPPVAKSTKKKFQRCATSDGVIHHPCNSPWQKRKSAMQKRRKSTPNKMPNFNWTLESDSDSDSEEEEEEFDEPIAPPTTSYQSSNTNNSAWDQRKTKLRERSKSPTSVDNSKRRARKKSASQSPSRRQPQGDNKPRLPGCRYTSKERKKKEDSSSRWESSSNRSNSPPRERRRSSGSGSSSCRWESSSCRSNSPPRRIGKSLETGSLSNPRLPRRQNSFNGEKRPKVPSHSHHQRPAALEGSDAKAAPLMDESRKLKLQVLQTKGERIRHAQTA